MAQRQPAEGVHNNGHSHGCPSGHGPHVKLSPEEEERLEREALGK